MDRRDGLLSRRVNAGELLQKVLGSHHAGGHDQIAGGRLQIEGDGGDWRRAARAVRDRLLQELGIQPCAATDLVNRE